MNVYFAKYSLNEKHTNLYHTFIKIGKANNVKIRIEDLQTGCPNHLILLGSIKCKSEANAFHLESEMHHYFRKFKTVGEWYKGYILSEVCKIIQYGDISRYLTEIGQNTFYLPHKRSRFRNT